MTGTLHTERPWDDPANERFVRRQVAEFLNPAVKSIVGDGGYPTTHFAGSGGVGADGPELPPTHRRAGLFGGHRARRRGDVRDGLSNTIAVFGIENRLGSWAEGGPATVRPLTAEPHVRGPDGFGTGSADSMLVLMADGSVRTITRDTDPILVRRMAAIADGLPLDLAVPGEPGDTPPTPPATQPVVRAMAQNPPDQPPISALDTARGAANIPAVKRPDADLVLSQRLALFDQSEPVSRRELLYTIEDLLGRKIVWSEDELGAASARLGQSISFRLEGVTVAQLFDQILAETGLEYIVEAEQIRLRPSKSSSLTP